MSHSRNTWLIDWFTCFKNVLMRHILRHSSSCSFPKTPFPSLLKDTKCGPRPTIVSVSVPNEQHTLLAPTHVEVLRCQGSCPQAGHKQHVSFLGTIWGMSIWASLSILIISFISEIMNKLGLGLNDCLSSLCPCSMRNHCKMLTYLLCRLLVLFNLWLVSHR